MQFSTLTLTSILAALAVALPSPGNDATQAQKRQFQAQLTFIGSNPDAKYTVSAPTDGSSFTISTFQAFSYYPFTLWL